MFTPPHMCTYGVAGSPNFTGGMRMEFVSSWIAAHRRSRCASSRLLSGVHLPRFRGSLGRGDLEGGSPGRGGCLRVELWKGSIRVLHDPDEFYNVLIVSGGASGRDSGRIPQAGFRTRKFPHPAMDEQQNLPFHVLPLRNYTFPVLRQFSQDFIRVSDESTIAT